MPSPFPGMDPFIEGQRWRDFHHSFIETLREQLVPRVLPRYDVEVEERVYLEKVGDDLGHPIGPDVSVWDSSPGTTTHEGHGRELRGSASAVLEPDVLTLPDTLRLTEGYLQIRRRGTMELVTVIEVLSPTNKSPSDGYQEYLNKRVALFETPVNLVEIDLLRGGTRLPTKEPLKPADYYTFVCRCERRPKLEVYGWPLRRRLPALPVPLAGDDPDVVMDLQEVLDAVYERAGYRHYLNYERNVEPPLDEADAEWVRRTLGKA